MTELLYMHDKYVREFEATIIESGEDFIVLDRSAFYPEGGGQSGDRGSISMGDVIAKVSGTRKVEGQVRHILDGPNPFSSSDKVKGTLDWGFRYECMRFHTGQHVLSRFLQLNYGLETVGNHITPGKSRADYHPIESFDEDMKRTVEAGVNEILSKNIDVEIKFMPRTEAISFLEERGYQTRYLDMVPKSVTEFRVLIIGDYDVASCAGTHVANTKEIGRIHIGKTKNVGANKRRIYFSLSSAD